MTPTTVTKPEIAVRNYGDLTIHPFASDPMPTLLKGLDLLADLRPYAHGGTALGIYRDNRFIPHDSDVDLAINLPWKGDYYTLTVELVRQAAQRNLTLLRSLIGPDRPYQLVWMDLENKGTWLDLEIFYSGIRPDYHVHYKTNGTVEILSRQITGQRFHPFRDELIPLPKRIQSYFVSRYGADWRTPMQKKGRWEDYTPAYHPWP